MRNEKKYSALLVLAMAVLFSGCRAIFYTPNRNPVPLFKEAGDVYIDASTNLLSKVDLTAGLAVADNIGAYIGYAGAFKSENYEPFGGSSTKYNYEGNMLNMGLGYFVNQKSSSDFRFEIFGDIGLGSFKNNVIKTNNQFFNGRYQRIGIMPNIGYSSPDNRFNFAYSARFSQIRFNNLNVSDSAFWRSDINRYEHSRSTNMLEQALTFRFGSEMTKFQIQIASYHGLISNYDLNTILFWNASIMFGVVFSPNLRQ